MRGEWKQFLSTALLTSMVVTAGVTIARQLGWLESSELGAYDQFIQMRASDAMDERILVVGIDENDIQSRKEYPIEDGTLADVLDVLESYNPRAIGVDIGRDVPQGDPAGRDRMIDILSSSDRIVTACVLSSEDEPGVPAAPGTDPELIGFADFPTDPDNVVRRSILISAPGEFSLGFGDSHLCNDPSPDNELLSLSLLLSLIYLEGDDIFPDQTPWGDLQLDDLVLTPVFEKTGGYASTGATDYQLMLNYRAPQNAVRQVSLTDVLQETVDPSWIEDRVVLIGYTSTIAKDFFSTPYANVSSTFRSMPGVVVHAQATSQLLSAVLDNRPLLHSWPELVEVLWIGLWTGLASALALYYRRPVRFIVISLALLVVYGGLCFGLFIQGLWLPLVPTVWSMLLAGLATQLSDKAKQSGYAQAIHEQIMAQLRGQYENPNGPDSDYLGALVTRARAVRQRRTGKALWDEADLSRGNKPPDQITFESPEMQEIYERIKHQAHQDWESERAKLEVGKSRQKSVRQNKRLQSLVNKAQKVRHQANPAPGSRSMESQDE